MRTDFKSQLINPLSKMTYCQNKGKRLVQLPNFKLNHIVKHSIEIISNKSQSSRVYILTLLYTLVTPQLLREMSAN